MAAHKRPLGAGAPEQEAACSLRKRPLGAVAPSQESAWSPMKRLRRAGLLVMWLEMGKARVVTVGQMAQMLRQAQLDVANSVMERLPNILERVLGEHFGAFKSSFMGCIEDKVQSIVQTKMKEQQAASLPSRVSEPPRQISEDFPETGGITRVKLCFVNVDRPEDPLFTGCPVKWQNGENPKVAIFENNAQITQGDHSKLQIEILAVYADFFTDQGREGFTKEEFSKQICMCNGKESVLKTVNLRNGEACIGSFFFTESSYRKILRLAARVKRQDLTIRVQEAITDPFVVKVQRSKQNGKSYPPSKEEAVHCLERISAKGKYCKYLASKNITTVKHLMRHYHIDKSGLQKLIDMKNEDWSTLIKHATKCNPGVEIYSYRVAEENTELLFNDFYDLVGMMIDGFYVLVNDLDQFQQLKANNWKMSAYKKFEERENSGGLTPDYLMCNGLPVRAAPLNNDAGPSVQARTTCQYPNDMAARREFGYRCPLNGFSRAAVLSNNNADPSDLETLPFSQPYEQTVHQGLGQHDPSMPQNGTTDYPPQGNVLNDQGSFSAQPTIPSHILVPAPEDDSVTGASLTGQQNGYLRFSTSDAPVTSYSIADVAGTSLDGVSLETSSLNHVPVDMSSGPPSDEFDDWLLDKLLAVEEYEANQGIAPTNNGELPNSNIQSHGFEHYGGNR